MKSVLPGEEWLWAVWGATTDALAVSDADGRVLAANPAYEVLYGYTVDEVIGSSFSIIFPETERAAAEAEYRAVFAGPAQQAPFTSVVQRRDGTMRTVESRISFLEHEGQRIAMLSIIRDITTEVAALRVAELADQARRDLLSSLSHDIKSPLAVIKGHAQTLRRRAIRDALGPAEQLVGVLEQIEDSALQVASLVDELVEVSGQDGSAPPALNRAPVDLVLLAGEAVKRHQRLTDERELRLETAAPSVVGQWDAARLRRVLDNLLENAVKYSPGDTPITVRITFDAPAPEPERAGEQVMLGSPRSGALLAVEDHGIGISPADRPHVFERFWRGSNVATSVAGAGIGLSSVRQVVEQHGGIVRIASLEGEGTTVTVWLPLEPPIPDADESA